MKSQNTAYLKNSIALLILFFITLSAHGQNVACPEVAAVVQNEPKDLLNEPTMVLGEIKEDDYPYLLNISGLKKYSNIKYRGQPISFYKNRNYDLISNGKQMKLIATYGEDGNLIKGSLVKKNSHLPVFIRENLHTYWAGGWQMIGNKIFINDFDPLKTEYEVELQHDDKKRTVYFDYLGKSIKRLGHS